MMVSAVNHLIGIRIPMAKIRISKFESPGRDIDVEIDDREIETLYLTDHFPLVLRGTLLKEKPDDLHLYRVATVSSHEFEVSVTLAGDDNHVNVAFLSYGDRESTASFEKML
jgi:hypothetical protein